MLIDSGSRYEVLYPSGISHFLEKLAFQVRWYTVKIFLVCFEHCNNYTVTTQFYVFFHVFMFYWLFVWLCFFHWHFIVLVSCMAASLFNKLTYFTLHRNNWYNNPLSSTAWVCWYWKTVTRKFSIVCFFCNIVNWFPTFTMFYSIFTIGCLVQQSFSTTSFSSFLCFPSKSFSLHPMHFHPIICCIYVYVSFQSTSKYAGRDVISQKLEDVGGICDCQASR